MLDFSEPFVRLLSQGMVVKYSEKEGKITKMSKSKGNVVGTNEFFDTYGADAARLFILFAAPVEAEVEWVDEGAQGQYRFIGRIWRLFYEVFGDKLNKKYLDQSFDFANLKEENKTILREYHKALKAITDDLSPERNGFNTSIARMSEFINAMYKYVNSRDFDEEDLLVSSHALFGFIKVIAPFTPHLAEELWQDYINSNSSVHLESWPVFVPEYIETNLVNLVVQIKGKKIDVIEAAKDLDNATVEKLALEHPKIKAKLDNLKIQKIIIVPNKIVNIVAV
jgi:leucyl-tRNA synthetase